MLFYRTYQIYSKAGMTVSKSHVEVQVLSGMGQAHGRVINTSLGGKVVNTGVRALVKTLPTQSCTLLLVSWTHTSGWTVAGVNQADEHRGRLMLWGRFGASGSGWLGIMEIETRQGQDNGLKNKNKSTSELLSRNKIKSCSGWVKVRTWTRS